MMGESPKMAEAIASACKTPFSKMPEMEIISS
jgi:hypothetical protein